LGHPTDGGLHPAIIYNRGGQQEVGALNGVEIFPLVEAGFVVAASQYRGNAGSEGREEFGGADVQDVLNLVPLLKQQADVDPERIGMMGHSRGGMMTYLALKQEALAGTHDIKAAVTVGGLADLIYTAESRPRFVRQVCAPLIGALPEEALEPYEARSATYWPELINAPLLIQQGGADEQVPALQSYRLVRGLKDAGKTVEFTVYHGEDHSLSGHFGGYPEALAWFRRQLGVPGDDYSFESHESAILEVMTWFIGSG
jgi:dipeptidyl aminopeptidase/acylaminoacyl peptidase